MNYQHKQSANGRWFELSLSEQMANIGSEVERTMIWKEKNNYEYSSLALERAIELLDLTASDEKNRFRLKEILRLRETLVDYFLFDNQFSSSDKLWRSYFLPFNYFARLNC